MWGHYISLDTENCNNLSFARILMHTSVLGCLNFDLKVKVDEDMLMLKVIEELPSHKSLGTTSECKSSDRKCVDLPSNVKNPMSTGHGVVQDHLASTFGEDNLSVDVPVHIGDCGLVSFDIVFGPATETERLKASPNLGPMPNPVKCVNPLKKEFYYNRRNKEKSLAKVLRPSDGKFEAPPHTKTCGKGLRKNDFPTLMSFGDISYSGMIISDT
ncbi:hypothetical protein Ancab_034030 [Ancistrocladus abbreviatus]